MKPASCDQPSSAHAERKKNKEFEIPPSILFPILHSSHYGRWERDFPGTKSQLCHAKTTVQAHLVRRRVGSLRESRKNPRQKHSDRSWQGYCSLSELSTIEGHPSLLLSPAATEPGERCTLLGSLYATEPRKLDVWVWRRVGPGEKRDGSVFILQGHTLAHTSTRRNWSGSSRTTWQRSCPAAIM